MGGIILHELQDLTPCFPPTKHQKYFLGTETNETAYSDATYREDLLPPHSLPYWLEEKVFSWMSHSLTCS